MSSEGSVTQWIRQLKAGDPRAAEQLWKRYYRQLVDVARRRLRGVPRRAADEEDVAQSAFNSFCKGAAEGRYPRLHDRGSLWPLLMAIAKNKASDLADREGAQKRGGGKVRDEAALSRADPAAKGRGLEDLPSREPTPEEAAQLTENLRRLLGLLDEPERAVALLRMEGYTNSEIAVRLDCAHSSVSRQLNLIKKKWKEGLR